MSAIQPALEEVQSRVLFRLPSAARQYVLSPVYSGRQSISFVRCWRRTRRRDHTCIIFLCSIFSFLPRAVLALLIISRTVSSGRSLFPRRYWSQKSYFYCLDMIDCCCAIRFSLDIIDSYCALRFNTSSRQTKQQDNTAAVVQTDFAGKGWMQEHEKREKTRKTHFFFPEKKALLSIAETRSFTLSSFLISFLLTTSTITMKHRPSNTYIRGEPQLQQRGKNGARHTQR